MSPRRGTSNKTPKGFAQAAIVNVNFYEAADHSFLVGVLGRLSPERAAKLLPAHAEVCDLGDGRVAAFIHVRAERVRPLIERLTGSSYSVNFSSQSPTVWAAGMGA